MDTQTQRTQLWLPRRVGGKDCEFWVSRCKLSYIGWINNKVLQNSPGDYIQYPMINCNGKEYEKIHVDLKSLYCAAESNTIL